MYDTLLSRYGDITFIMSMPMDEGLQLYQKASEKNLENRIWERWLVDYRNMNTENFVSFGDYKKKLTEPKRVDKRSEEEVIADADDILKMMKRT